MDDQNSEELLLTHCIITNYIDVFHSNLIRKSWESYLKVIGRYCVAFNLPTSVLEPWLNQTRTVTLRNKLSANTTIDTLD